MARKNVQAWALAEQQYWVLSRQQLLALGYTSEAIDVRLEDARLHRVFGGVYAAGRPHVSRDGYLMAAVLASGEGAALSDFSAGEHSGITKRRPGPIHVAVPHGRKPCTGGIKVHRRTRFDVRIERGIPTTSPICTVIDLSHQLGEFDLERVINEAFNRDLVNLDELRDAARGRSSKIGRLLDRDAFVVTDTLRFTHWQVWHEPGYVESVLRAA